MQYCDTLLSDRAHETDVSSCGRGARAEEEGEVTLDLLED